MSGNRAVADSCGFKMSEIQKTPKIRLGVDLGGTKIEIIALDENGQTLLRERVKTPAGDYAKTIDCIVQLVDFLGGGEFIDG